MSGTGRWGASAMNVLLTEGWAKPGGGYGITESKPNSYTNELEVNGLTGIAKYEQRYR